MNRRLILPFLILPLLTAGCTDSPQEEDEPKTPEAMYARAQELLSPSVDREEPDYAHAMEWLLKAGRAGYLQAQLDLGGIYFAGGKGVEKNGSKSLEWFTRAAEQGDAQALVFMGEILFHGIDVEPDQARAMECWRQASEAGVAEADFNLGNVMITRSDTVLEGVEHLKRAATGIQGSLGAKAATRLGWLYWNGRGPLQPDKAASVEWYRRGADAGDADAQYIYALFLLDGEFTPRDEEKAMFYLRLAAGQDHPEAMAVLINRLRTSPARTEETDAEADAWQQRLDSLRSAN